MGESNGPWGLLAEHDAEAAQSWDRYQPLPEPGINPVLDAFCRRKNITISALMKQGARLSDDNTMCYPYERALKYRNMNDGSMWNRAESEFPAMKIVWQGAGPSEGVIVVEGETDAARVTDAYELDVAIMPAGAKNVTFPYVAQLREYQHVYLGLDNDAAGNEGIGKWQSQLSHAVVFRPEGADWCDTASADLPDITSVDAPKPTVVLVNAADLMELEVPDIPSYFDNALLPVGGSMVIHGWAKAYKSFVGMDGMASLATGQPWIGFNNMEEPVRVAVLQYEIPWPYYKQRVAAMREHAEEQGCVDEFDENFITYSPLVRPQLIAGNTAQEDEVLRNLTAANIEVMLIDPVRRMAGAADLNSEQDVRKILGFFERLNDNAITVIYTHHDNKGGAAPGSGEGAASMTGSGAFAGDPDSIVNLTLPRGETWESSTIRNVSFLLRNAPSPSMRGMEIHETGRLTYTTMPHGFEPEVVAVDDDGTEPSL